MNKDTTSVEEKMQEFDRIYIDDNMWKSDDESMAYASVEGMRKWIFDALLEAHTAGASAMLQRVRDYVSRECVKSLDTDTARLLHHLATLQKEIEGKTTEV